MKNKGEKGEGATHGGGHAADPNGSPFGVYQS